MTKDSSEERLIWLLQISRHMLATRDLARLLSLITDAFIELAEADRGFLVLRDRNTDALVPKISHTSTGGDIPPPEPRISSVIHRVVKEQKPVFATDTGSQDEIASSRSASETQLKMTVCVPIATEADVLGALYADGHTSLDKAFTNTNRRAFEMLADHAAAAIENARMFERATNDPLTGLPNSSYFLMQLSKAMREATDDRQAGVLLLDLDAFKRVNMAAGAEAGDRALSDVAATLQDVLRTDGLVARYGSDKFAILLPPEEGTSISLRLRDVAERARAAVSTKTYHGVKLSASIGGVPFPRGPVENPPDLVALADDALAKARAMGTGEVEIEN